MSTIAIAIRTLGDPRPAVYRWASEADSTTWMVIIHRDDGEPVPIAGGRLSAADLRSALREIAEMYGLRVVLVDRDSRQAFYEALMDMADESGRRQLRLLRERRHHSYGVATNEAFLVSTLLGTDMTQFADDDTLPLAELNVLARHRDIAGQRDAVAVTGTYLGAPWLDATLVSSVPGCQASFAASLMRHIPTRRPIQASASTLAPSVDEQADYIIGGNSLVTARLAATQPVPIMLEAIGTDDILLGLLGSRRFPGRVRRSGIPVVHAHLPARREAPAVTRYLRNCARSVACFALLSEDWLEFLAADPSDRDRPALHEEHARSAVAEFFRQLTNSRADMLPSLNQILDVLTHDSSGRVAFGEDVVETARAGLEEYVDLLAAWPALVVSLSNDVLRRHFLDAAIC